MFYPADVPAEGLPAFGSAGAHPAARLRRQQFRKINDFANLFRCQFVAKL